MEIKIDTKKDSKEDIEKAIVFLQQFVDSEALSNMPEVNDGAFNIFNKETDKSAEIKKDDEEINIRPILY
ncbi:hypothetical protein JW930_07275 [Candidatus Woesearchaeota archaeon]|nr:hypothetical protein [Candidatus Woesearchaeota archaeon]